MKNKKETKKENEEEEINYPGIIRYIFKGFYFVFFFFTLAIICKYAFQINWLTYITEVSTITFTIMLYFIKRKINKKEKEKEIKEVQ